jgi:hypothetical protein
MVTRHVPPFLVGCLAGAVLLALKVLAGNDESKNTWLVLLLPFLFGLCTFVMVVFWWQPSRIIRTALAAAVCLACVIVLSHAAALTTGLAGASGPERFGFNVLMVVPIILMLLVVCLVFALMASVQSVRHARSLLNHLPLIAFLVYVGRLVAKALL